MSNVRAPIPAIRAHRRPGRGALQRRPGGELVVSLVSVAVLAALAACSSGSTPSQPGGPASSDAGTGSEASADSSGADSGGGSDSAGAGAGAFIGTWMVIGGTGTYICPDSTDPWPNPATIYILAGMNPGEVISSNPDLNACSLTWKVDGLNATLISGTCSFYGTIVTKGSASISSSGMLQWSLQATTGPSPVCSGTESVEAIPK